MEQQNTGGKILVRALYAFKAQNTDEVGCLFAWYLTVLKLTFDKSHRC